MKDLDGDGQLDRLTFNAKRQHLRIEFLDADGNPNDLEVVDGVKDLSKVLSIQVERRARGELKRFSSALLVEGGIGFEREAAGKLLSPAPLLPANLTYRMK